MPPVRMHTSDSSGGTDLPSVALTGAHGRPTPSETGASATHDGGHAHKRSYSSSLCTESGFVVRTPPSLRNLLVEEVAVSVGCKSMPISLVEFALELHPMQSQR